MKLTVEIIMAGTGATAIVAAKWKDALQTACDRYEIDNRRRVAMFLANVGVECSSLTKLEESLNYSAQRMAEVWPSRYAVNPKTSPKQPNALALSLAGKPEKLANNVYASRLGNGPESSGDGWKYRGQGPIMVTGKSNFKDVGYVIGIDLVANPAVIQQPMAGAMSAAYFWKSRGCNTLADGDQFSNSVLKVNGAAPCDANHGPLRKSRYIACLDAIDKLYYGKK